MLFNVPLKAVALFACATTASANTHTLDVKVNGNIATLDEADQMDYDQSQNQNGATVILDGDMQKAILNGNMWKAFALGVDGVEVNESTVLRFKFALTEAAEFQAICLDENLELSADSGAADFASGRRCFALANTQSWLSNLIYAPHLVDPGESMTFEIPVGHYFTGNMKYLALLQDNDADRMVGLSEFSDIEIVDEETAMLEIEVEGQQVSIPAHPQLDYYINEQFDQDSRFWIMHVSESGSSIQMSGNQFKALKIPGDGIAITSDTVLDFEFSVQALEEFHGICLDEDLQLYPPIRCFRLAGTQVQEKMYKVLDETKAGESHHYQIPIGLFYPGITARYLAFVQDNDKSDKSTGKSTFSNIKVYDVERPPLKISVFGSEMSIENKQLEYNEDEDTLFHPLEVSPSGASVTLEGNIHRALKFPSPVTITEATELDFEFTLNTLTDYHAICLEEDLTYSNSKRCFMVAHEQGKSFYYLKPQANEAGVGLGVKMSYNVPVGLKYKGTFNYLVFLQDNDEGNKSGGNSTFENIVIRERPELKISRVSSNTAQIADASSQGSNDMLIFNHQLSYEDRQDTDDNLMVVSDDSNSISMRGNLWKAMALTESLDITDDTVLQFDFLLTEETEIHAICLEEDLYDDNGARCFKVAGSQTENLGNVFIYRDIHETHEGEQYSYMIRLSEFFKGTMNYIVFIHDNDSSDKTTGESTYSNIKVFEAESCLAAINQDFEFSTEECTAESFTTQIEMVDECSGRDPWPELLAFFDVNLEHQVRDRIGKICGSAYSVNNLAFNEVTGKESQFNGEYLDGGTVWNYGHETKLDGGQTLFQAANKVQEVRSMLDIQPRGIAWPDVHNFHGCELRAAMCCFVSRREPNGVELEDNSDACYMDFKKARQSSHVRDGYSIYGNGAEGNLNCQGIAWGNDPGHADSAFKGNNLFHVAMKNGLYDNGFAEELPGAPLCGCIEQMPVVTKAACTKVEADQMVTVKYTAATASFSAKVAITKISHVACGNLSDYYGHLVAEGKATAREKALLDDHLVGDSCDTALGNFLESKGFVWPTA